VTTNPSARALSIAWRCPVSSGSGQSSLTVREVPVVGWTKVTLTKETSAPWSLQATLILFLSYPWLIRAGRGAPADRVASRLVDTATRFRLGADGATPTLAGEKAVVAALTVGLVVDATSGARGDAEALGDRGPTVALLAQAGDSLERVATASTGLGCELACHRAALPFRAALCGPTRITLHDLEAVARTF